MSCRVRGMSQMRIEISIENKDEDCFEHYGYFDTINEAIQTLQNLHRIEINERVKANSLCSRCVFTNTCWHFLGTPDCPDYKRDPPDGGYYG